ncbi:MAG: 7-cyano-7-deazaguanine synthase QueC [Chlamydiales bacterium]|nr:7-cyano-7-deazaguanine synthase QueC [Chlamydiia bacterium]MCP5508146.1 7-cyano-7-deazaguanine synthase QueC [Chlamydiales bacterium]
MKTVILLSGGIDSTVCLAIAKSLERECFALSFDYKQQHRIELEYAKKIAAHFAVDHHIITINPHTFASSALLGTAQADTGRTPEEIANGGIPKTYVPARNILFLSYALGYAELLGAEEIYFGANALDRYGYPDCRPAFIEAYQNVINAGTQMGIDGHPPQIITPLLNLDKRQIITKAVELGVTIEMTWSCYAPTENGTPCNQCDACVLRTTSTPD